MIRNNKFLKIFILTVVIIAFVGISYNVNADMGAKPSITIKLKNMTTTNYVIDLLEYAETDEDFYPDSNFSGKTENEEEIRIYTERIAEERGITIEQVAKLYNINYSKWISSCTRNSLLWGTCAGNEEYSHYFNYFGTPSIYRILILLEDGTIKVTDVIHRNNLNSEVELDINTMEVVTNDTNNGFVETKAVVNPILITVIVEVIIALIMKIKNMKIIISTNIITNILLQILLVNMPQSYIAVFIISEILIFISEYLIYAKYIKKTSKTKILCYTLISNLVTLALTFII